MTENGEPLCARCARTGKTCCQGTQVFLTQGDVRRAATAAGRDDFYESAPPPDPAFLPDAALDPVWSRIYDQNGRRRILAHRPNGDCVFLGSAGCALWGDARPSVCLLYPFEYTDAAIKGVDASYCPLPEGANAPLLLALLGMGRDRAEECRRRLYREILEEFPDEVDEGLHSDEYTGAS